MGGGGSYCLFCIVIDAGTQINMTCLDFWGWEGNLVRVSNRSYWLLRLSVRSDVMSQLFLMACLSDMAVRVVWDFSLILSFR